MTEKMPRAAVQKLLETIASACASWRIPKSVLARRMGVSPARVGQLIKMRDGVPRPETLAKFVVAALVTFSVEVPVLGDLWTPLYEQIGVVFGESEILGRQLAENAREAAERIRG